MEEPVGLGGSGDVLLGVHRRPLSPRERTKQDTRPIGCDMTRMIAAAFVVSLVAAAGVSAAAAGPPFTNGDLVASRMEERLNSAGYKRRLSEASARLTQRVLCAHDPVLSVVECTGRMVVKGKRVKAGWELVKRSASRAKLTWTFSGPGVFEYDSEIVAPSAFRLSRF